MKKWLLSHGMTIFALAVALLVLWPLALMFSLATWRSADVTHLYQQGIPCLSLIPPVVSLEQFVRIVFEQYNYLHMFFNSLMLSAGIGFGAVVVDFFAGYVLAKVRFRGRGFVCGIYVFAMLLPLQVTLLPVYIASRTMGLINSWWSMILPGIFAPLGVFFMQQFLVSLPDEMVACMRMETRSTLCLLLHGILPYAMPGLITLFVIVFAENWGMVEQPLLLLTDPAKFPLSLALCSKETVPQDIAFAAAVIFSLPAFVFYILFQDQIQTGIGGFQPK